MQKNPPRIVLRFFRWFCHPDILFPVEGDLMELYDERVERSGKRKADLLFIRDVILLFRPGIIRPAEGTHSLNNYGMIKNYFKVGIRNILKHKAFSFINIFGLAMAMAVSLFIMLMLSDQTSYDNFHPNGDRIIRVLTSRSDGGPANASSPLPLGAYAKENYAAILNATTLLPKVGGDVIYINENVRRDAEIRGFFADDQFFSVLGFELSTGNKYTALSQPNSMVISSDIAYRLFKDSDPIGRQVEFSDRGLGLMKIDLGSMKEGIPQDFGTYQITGVINTDDYKSHIKFDALISSATLPVLYQSGLLRNDSDNWNAYSRGYTYLLTEKDQSEESVNSLLDEIRQVQYADSEDLKDLSIIAQPLTAISPGKFVGNPISLRLPIEVYYILAALALIIILSACLNYTNLSIARLGSRTQEIGIRKVNGASRTQLVVQFLTESFLASFLALLIANLLIWFLRPLAGKLWIASVLQFDMNANLTIFFGFTGLAVTVALIAGFYPAIVVSRYNPVSILKGGENRGSGMTGFRKFINVVQLGFSLMFIITSILLARQFHEFTDHDYGFDAENIINIPLQGNDYRILANEFGTVPGVENVSASEFVPALLYRHGASIAATKEAEAVNAENISISPDFTENIGVSLIAGSLLEETDNGYDQIVVNEKTVEAMNFNNAHEAVGQTVYVNGRQKTSVIKGVIEDFNFETPFMGEGNMPLILYHLPESFSYLNVKITQSEYTRVLAGLQEKWESIDPVHPIKFYNYSDQLINSNRWFGDLAAIIGAVTLLAVVISCLGLLGMSMYTAERRTKEVGIRKMLGASRKQLMLLLGRSYAILMAVTILIFAPLSYLLNSFWLDHLPNRVQLGAGTMLAGVLILLGTGLVTIFSQLARASGKNPVDIIKTE